MESLERALNNYKAGNKRLTKGDLDFVIENCLESQIFIELEIEEDEVNKIN
ncbi:hypothetical protein [Metabacillus fastidiosus]|uniref:hypothetical protein n=1 Tax=Metabacillus fastidiosus TaxID=1458 RepID=UPI003D2AE02D